jgi:hypothetical protein
MFIEYVMLLKICIDVELLQIFRCNVMDKLILFVR